MTFVRQGADLALSKLSLAGDRISAPTKIVQASTSRSTRRSSPRPAGRPGRRDPLRRPARRPARSRSTCWTARCSSRPPRRPALSRLPIASVVLDGAVGPGSRPTSPTSAPRSSCASECASRRRCGPNFRVLLKRAGKDRAAVKAIAGEQAGFSSAARDGLPRLQAQETVHGFCSTQMTEARVLALLAKFGPEPRAARSTSHPRARPRLAPAASEATRGRVAPDATRSATPLRRIPLPSCRVDEDGVIAAGSRYAHGTVDYASTCRVGTGRSFTNRGTVR